MNITDICLKVIEDNTESKKTSLNRCKVPGCHLMAKCRGRCTRHYQKLMRSGSDTIMPPKIYPTKCSVPDCTHSTVKIVKGMCFYHYHAKWKKGPSKKDTAT